MQITDLFASDALRGKVSVVTGAGRGLGRAFASALANAGSDLVLVARNIDELTRTAREVEEQGVQALAVSSDLTIRDDIDRMVQQALTRFGKIDVLVNNAGQSAAFVRHKFEEIPEDEWKSMIETNVTGLFLVTQAVGKVMLAQGAGKVINIASAVGVRPTPQRLCYSVSKAAVMQMTRALALEWAGRGVTVNCIAPGSLDNSPDSTDEACLKMNEERKRNVPMGRLGTFEDVSMALVYLASRASDFVSGATFFIDGAMVLG